MQLPGFSAESSLYQTATHYYSRALPCPGDGVDIYLAAYVDRDCFDDCFQQCSDICFESTEPGRRACVAKCNAHNATCRLRCTRPGSPSGSAPPAACASGLTNCGGSCVDLMFSSSNCGACGVSCPQGSICCGGTCGTSCISGGCCPAGNAGCFRCMWWMGGSVFCSPADVSWIPGCSRA